MKDAILASEWAELWPGARRAGFGPSSAPLSLQSCPFYACFPTWKIRSRARWPPHSGNVGEQWHPWICPQTVFGEKKRLLDWVGLLFRLVGSPAGLQIEPSSLLTEDDSSFPCPPPHPLLGRMKLRADLEPGLLLCSFLPVTKLGSTCSVAQSRDTCSPPRLLSWVCVQTSAWEGLDMWEDRNLPATPYIISYVASRCTRLRTMADHVEKLVSTVASISRGHLSLFVSQKM